MKSRVGEKTLAWVIGLTLVVALAASGWRYQRQKQAALEAQGNLAACQQLAARILELRHQPTLAVSQSRSSGEIDRQIEAAAAAVGLEGRQIVRIEPQPLRRLGQTAYEEQPTRVELSRVTLPQLVGLVDRLTSPETGLDVHHLTLRTPHQESTESAAGEAWGAELTLTYLLFRPQTSAASGSSTAPLAR
jgi:hypothetical protein